MLTIIPANNYPTNILLAVRLKDWQDAELSLRALLNITSSHSIALESVVLFLESDPANKRNYASEYYSMLFAKFPQ